MKKALNLLLELTKVVPAKDASHTLRLNDDQLELTIFTEYDYFCVLLDDEDLGKPAIVLLKEVLVPSLYPASNEWLELTSSLAVRVTPDPP